MNPEFVSIEISPSVQCGNPCLAGTRIPVSTISSFYMSGDPIDLITDMYQISRAQVLVAFWYMGFYGTRREKKLWKEWATEYLGLFWKGESREVPDPPREIK